MTLRLALVYTAKNAVNAALLSGIQMVHDPVDNNFHNWHGIQGILWAIGSAIAIREFTIWFPHILKWSTTDAIPQP